MSRLADFGITEDIPETGETLQENSLQKARYIYDRKGCDCFADDTGLEVDALGGAPGVYTARYAGPSKDFNLNMDKVLAELHAAIVDNAEMLWVVHDVDPRAMSPRVQGFVQARSWFQDLTRVTVNR